MSEKVILGVDIGYFANKGRGEGGNSYIPSVIGSANRARMSVVEDNVFSVVVDDVEYFVGDDAVRDSRTEGKGAEKRDWYQSNPYMVLFLSTLTELIEGNADVKLVTGLPIQYFSSDADALEKRLTGEFKITRNGRAEQTFNVTHVRAVEQGFGASIDIMMDDKGNFVDSKMITSKIGCVDMGGRTVNFIAIHELSEVNKDTASVNIGGWNAVRAMKDYLSVELPDGNYRDHVIATAIQERKIEYYGDDKDLTQACEMILRPMAEQIVSEMAGLWSEGSDLYRVILTGGGSLMFGAMVDEMYGHPNTIHHNDPVYGNANGYYKYGLRLESGDAW